jgi:hypothetical protein
VRRPSFQFYPGDWTSNSNLRRCTHAEKGIWMDVMCLMHDQEDYGILRWPLTEIAVAVGCTVAALRKIAEKGIMKGADTGKQVEPFLYAPRTGRKDGEPVPLVRAQMGPLWYSSRMVKDEYVRTIRGESSRFGAGDGDAPKPTPKAAPKPPFGDGSSASSSSSPSGKPKAVPNGTDAVASKGLTAHEAIFQIAVPWLVANGGKEANVRSVLGAAEKHLTPDGAWQLARECMAEKPLEPVAWIAAALNARKKVGTAPARRNGQPSPDEINAENAKAKALLFGDSAEVIDV